MTTQPRPTAATATPPARFRTMIRRYWDVIAAERRLALTSLALRAIAGVLEVAALGMLVPLFGDTAPGGGGGGWFTTMLENLGFHGRDVIWAAVVGLTVLSVGAALTSFAADASTLAVRSRTEAHLRKDLTDRLLDMDWSSFLMMRFGDIANSLMMESSQVGAGLQQFLTWISSIIMTAVFVVLALLLSVRLTLVVLGFAVFGLLVLRPMGRRAERHTQGLTDATAGIARRITDVLGNLKFFRSTASYRRAQFSEGYDDYALWFQRTLISPLTVRLIYELSALAFIAVMLALSLVGKRALPAATLVFLAIFFRLSPRINDLQAALLGMRLQFPWLTRWKERLALAADHQMRVSGTAAPTFAKGLSAEEVSFAFPSTGTKVLDDVSWNLGPGESVAFVGESGAGKTTMLDLVTGLLVPTAGRITVDGVPLTDVAIDAWRSHIGVVLQESPLFHATVRENVVGDLDADDALVWRCLAAAHAKSFVQELPDQLGTVIGERGGRLSGGQRQRLGLARALYPQPWLLILDEATSALDSGSEEVVLNALQGLRGNVSMMIVAHRLATVEMADRIYVLEGGRIVQCGSWAELMSDAHGPFARIAAKQGLLVPASRSR